LIDNSHEEGALRMETTMIQFDEAKMLEKVKSVLERLDQNKQLQDLAMDNGLDVRNKLELTDSTKENVAVSVLTLLIAKESNDPEYTRLVRVGLDKRETKTAIINKYKNQAIQLITKYRNENKK